MLRLIASRLLTATLTLLLVSMAIFVIVELLPGDVATRVLGRDATPETIATYRERLRLDEPAPVRYGAWLGGIVRGDLGV